MPQGTRRRSEVDEINENKNDHFDFKCKYTRAYLQENRNRGIGKGYAPSSYINFFYMGGNAYQSKKLLSELLNPEYAFSFFSTHGANAYYPIDMLNEEINKKYKLIVALKKLDPSCSYREIQKKLGGKEDEEK